MHQLHRYQRQAPLMLTPNVFCVAADEDEFRYGTVLFHDASKDDIERHLDLWGPWLSLYPNTKGWWNDPQADSPGRSARGAGHRSSSTQALPRPRLPCSTSSCSRPRRERRRRRSLAISSSRRSTTSSTVQRALIGKPVGCPGSHGPDLAHAGVRQVTDDDLRREPSCADTQRFSNPTVLIVVDRRDLKTQLSDDFDACDYPNVEKALGVEDLKRKLRSDWRGTLVTTLQSFQQMGDLAPAARGTTSSAWWTKPIGARRARARKASPSPCA